MKTELCRMALNIDKAIKYAKECECDAFQIEVTTSRIHPCASSDYYYVVLDDPTRIDDYIRYIMNYLFDILGYTGHDVDVCDVSEDGNHAKQITVRF